MFDVYDSGSGVSPCVPEDYTGIIRLTFKTSPARMRELYFCLDGIVLGYTELTNAPARTWTRWTISGVYWMEEGRPLTREFTEHLWKRTKDTPLAHDVMALILGAQAGAQEP
jgi:hypothetical protein